jgi:AcrR family transcriptional regulator
LETARLTASYIRVSSTYTKYTRPRISPRRYTLRARAQAAEATARRIVEAFLARLTKQWFDEITLDRVAEDAGVTVQTVVRRFGGKEGLLAEAVQIMGDQVSARRATPPGDIGRLVSHLFEDYEQSGDAVIRLLALEPRHAALKKFLAVGRRWHRDWVAGHFEAEFARLDRAARTPALDALVIATDVYTWKLLRRDMGRSLSAARTTMKQLICAALAAFNTSHAPGDRR